MREGVFVIGLTGSIGMGKSTVASMFRDLGAYVIDSDAVVHELLGFGGAAVPRVSALCPEARVENDRGEVGIDRVRLGGLLSEREGLLSRLESILHPLISERRAADLDRLQADFAKDGELRVAVIEAALLLEKGLDAECDSVVVVSAPYDLQAARVLGRENMDEEKFRYILSCQMSDEEKRERADLVLDSSASLSETRKSVKEFLKFVVVAPLE